MVDGFKFQIRTTLILRLGADEIEVLVPTPAQVQRQITSNLPIVLEIHSKHLRATRQVEIGISSRCGHSNHGARRREAPWASQDRTGLFLEVNFQSWIKLKESAQLWFPKIIRSDFECMCASVN